MADPIVNPLFSTKDEYSVQDLNNFVRAYANNDEYLKGLVNNLQSVYRLESDPQGGILTPEELQAAIDQLINLGVVFDDPNTSPYIPSRHDTITPDNDPRYANEIVAILKKEPWVSLLMGVDLNAQRNLRILQLFDFLRGLLFWVIDGTYYDAKPIRVTSMDGDGFLIRIHNHDGDWMVVDSNGEPLLDNAGKERFEPLPVGGSYISLLTYRIKRIMTHHLRTLYRVSAFEAGLSSNSTDLSGDYLKRQIAWDGAIGVLGIDRRRPPVVSAGSDRVLLTPSALNMSGAFGVDDLDGPGVSQWMVVSEPSPGAAIIDDPAEPKTSVNFTAPGSYTLRLTVSSDTLTSSDEMTVAVQDVAIGDLPDGFLAVTTGDATIFQAEVVAVGEYQLLAQTGAVKFYNDNFAYIKHVSTIVDGEVSVRVLQPPNAGGSPADEQSFAGILIRNEDFPTDVLIGLAVDETGEIKIVSRDRHHDMIQIVNSGVSEPWLKIVVDAQTGRFSDVELFASPDGVSWTSLGEWQYRNPPGGNIGISMFCATNEQTLDCRFDNFVSTWFGGNTQVTPKIDAGISFTAVLNEPIQVFGILAHDIDFGNAIVLWQSRSENVVIANPSSLQPTVTITNTGDYRLVMQSWSPGGTLIAVSEVIVRCVATASSELFSIPSRYSCGWAEKGSLLFLRENVDVFAREIDPALLNPNVGGSIVKSFIQDESYVVFPQGLLRIPRSIIRFRGEEEYPNQLTVLTLVAEMQVFNDPANTGWQEPWQDGDVSIVPVEKDLGMGLFPMPEDGILTGDQKATLDVVGQWKYQHGTVIGHIVDGQARYVSIRVGIKKWAIDPADFFDWLRSNGFNSAIDELRRINANSVPSIDSGIWHTVGLSNRLIGQYLSQKYLEFNWDDGQLISADLEPFDLDTAEGSRVYRTQLPLIAYISKNDRPFSVNNFNGCSNDFADAWSMRVISSVQEQQNTILISDGAGGIEIYPESFIGARAIIFMSNGENRVSQIAQRIGDVLALLPDGDLRDVRPGDVIVIDRQVPEESLDGDYRNEVARNNTFDLRSTIVAPVDVVLRKLPNLTSPEFSPAPSPYVWNPGPGDINIDKVVDMKDVDDLLANWQRNAFDQGFQESYDIDNSGTINYGDLELMTQLYGNSYSPNGPWSPMGSPFGSPMPVFYQWFLDRAYNSQALLDKVRSVYGNMREATESIGRYNYSQRFMQKGSNFRRITDLRDPSTVIKDMVLEWVNNWEENQGQPWIRDEGIMIHWPEKNLETTGKTETVIPLSRYDTSNVAGEDDRIIIDELGDWGTVPQLVHHWNAQNHIRYPARFDETLTFISEKSFVIPGHTKLAGTFFFRPEDTHIVDPVVKVTLTQDQFVGGVLEEVYLGSFDFTLGSPTSFANPDGVFLIDGDANYNPITNRIRINYSSILDFSTDQPGKITFAYSYNDLAVLHPIYQFSPRQYGLEISHMSDAKMFRIKDGVPERLTYEENDETITPILRLEGITNDGSQIYIRWNRDDIRRLLGSTGGFIRSWWTIRGLPWIEIKEVTYDDAGEATDVEFDIWWVDENPTATSSITDERCKSVYDPCLLKYAWVDAAQTDIHTEEFPLQPRFIFYQKQPFQNFDGTLKLGATVRSLLFVTELPPPDYRWTQIWNLSVDNKESLNSMAVLTDRRTKEMHVVFGVYRDGINAGNSVILSDEITLGTVSPQTQLFLRREPWMDDPSQFQLDFVGMLVSVNDTALDPEFFRTNNKLQQYGYWYAGHPASELLNVVSAIGVDGIRIDVSNLTFNPLFWRHGDVPHSYLYRWTNLLVIGRDQNRPGAP